jgi:hypothetical protein
MCAVPVVSFSEIDPGTGLRMGTEKLKLLNMSVAPWVLLDEWKKS